MSIGIQGNWTHTSCCVVVIFGKVSWPLHHLKFKLSCQDLFTRVVREEMNGKKIRKSAGGSKVKVVFEELHITRRVAEKAPNKSSEDSAFWSNESGGNLDVQPSLAVGNVDLIFVSENPRGSSMETRKKVRRRRAGHLGELRTRQNVVQDLITSPGTEATEVEESVARYKEAFHNFVRSHENFLRYEDDEEKIALTNDGYDSQRDMKLQLDILVSEWWEEKKREERPPMGESNFNHASARSVESSAFSTNSVKERKRLMEETKLGIRARKKKQESQRELERVEKGTTELNTKLEQLDAKTKLQ